MQPDFHISIVSYNTRALLGSCLESLFSQSSRSTFEVTVIDNGSTDGSVGYAREHFPQVRVLESGGNIGYGRANNLALLGWPGRYYLILNSDLVLLDGALDAMAAYLDEHANVGVAGGALMNPERETLALPWRQWRVSGPQTNWAVGELTVASVVWEQTFLSRIFANSRTFGDYFRAYWDRAQDASVPQACGAFLAVRADLFNRLGGFDPLIFMYCEDTDLCRRIRDGGFDIGYVSKAEAIHVHGQSSAGALRPRMIFEHNKSRVYYFAKHAGPGAAGSAQAAMAIGALLRVGTRLLSGAAHPGDAKRYAAEARGYLSVFFRTLLMRVPKPRAAKGAEPSAGGNGAS